MLCAGRNCKQSTLLLVKADAVESIGRASTDVASSQQLTRMGIVNLPSVAFNRVHLSTVSSRVGENERCQVSRNNKPTTNTHGDWLVREVQAGTHHWPAQTGMPTSPQPCWCGVEGNARYGAETFNLGLLDTAWPELRRY